MVKKYKIFFETCLDGVDMEVKQGELLGVMGPNGSGKSTLWNCITGVLTTSGGKVSFQGRDITGWKSSSIYTDYAYVLEEGRNKCDGPAEDIRTNEEIKRLYLGG